MLHQFAGPGGTSHTHIFNAAAESTEFMALEMGHGNEYIRIYNLGTDVGCLHMLLINADTGLAASPEAIGNDNGRLNN